MIRNIVLVWVSMGVFSTLTDPIEPPAIIKLETPFDTPGDEVPINLVPVQTFLANKNLPVWIVEESNPYKLQAMTNVMKELGPFTTYWDLDTCSAALFFHDTSELEGTLGHDYAMHKLKYNVIIDRVLSSRDTLFKSPLAKHLSRLMQNVESPVRPVEPQEIGVKSVIQYPETVYVETLVVINYDITKEMRSDYAEIVKYILALFNTVDMLYSKINIPIIRINIAGIIIANHMRSLHHFVQCYQGVTDRNGLATFALSGPCLLRAIFNSLQDYHLPFQSYDIVLFFTRSTLLPVEVDPNQWMSYEYAENFLGISWAPHPSGDGFKQTLQHIGIAAISDPENFGRFPTVAHEISHLLGVPHDAGRWWRTDGTCDANIMNNRGSYCKECLTFGGSTPDFLSKFFGTRDGCVFHNKPRSLNDPPGPRLFWAARDQCQCYGFPSAYNPRKCSPVFHSFVHQIRCGEKLKCVDKFGRIQISSTYMDGTQCDKIGDDIKVCWNEGCEPIQKDHDEDVIMEDHHMNVDP